MKTIANSLQKQFVLWKDGVETMDKKTIGKYAMMGLGFALTLASSFVSGKTQDAAIKESVAEEVAKQLKNQAKGS